ncbi:LbetaH domain-containing protein [Oryzicola mucosus]|uniref:Colanic acid biosynthesis acetyltransferase WcaF n=1 Tax=Oryzicola mucosus TaxID=2767425 RepID=A0A8J6PTU8_9HYPH|nr:colanic acid biosynthesis acetyltransferase WcaF [Oryzicola mucosus]MBD0413477.1 colanic acid biosynthesis acetyltransferase WcaF [Oryzicola mucosus]
MKLGEFQRPAIDGNWGYGWRIVWYIVNALVFQSAIVGLLPSRAKAALLRLFGARVGTGFVCKPGVNIKYPWFLNVGDYVWLGEGVWIDNLCRVEIGNNVCISQGVKILTGSHDWSRPDFPFFALPVTIGDHVWITAHRVIRPGVEIPPQVAVLADIGRRDAEQAYAKLQA